MTDRPVLRRLLRSVAVLTNYTASEVHELANRLEGMVRALRVIQGRMLSGIDIPEVKWNDATFLLRLAEVEQYFESMTTKYERESLKAKHQREKVQASRRRGKDQAADARNKKIG